MDSPIITEQITVSVLMALMCQDESFVRSLFPKGKVSLQDITNRANTHLEALVE